MSDPRNHPKADVTVRPDHFCHLHMGFLKAEWPAGYATFALYTWQAFVEDERVCAVTGGKVENLQARLGEFAPICCYLGDTIMEPIITRAKETIEKTRGAE